MKLRIGRRAGLLTLACVAAVTLSMIAGVPSAVAAAAPHRWGAPQHAAGYQPPKIGHVWTIILENKSYEATFSGLNQNDYLWKTPPTYGELLRQYYGTGHYSLDNYISLVAGQAPAPANQADCGQYTNVAPGFPATDGQTYASTGCVYPSSVKTLFNQLDSKKVSWKVYAQDMGNDPTREQVYRCGRPGDPSGAGVIDPGGATPTDQYVPKHNPAPWFHALTDSTKDCKNVVPLDGYAATLGHQAIPSLATDLKSVKTTPAFSWISPNDCSDAHDATCKGDNLSGGNSFADYTGNTEPSLNVPTDTAESVVACCNELPGPNTTQPGFQAFGQDTTPGGGITGAVFISRFIKPGSISDQPYNHYGWLKSMEDLFHVTTGGTDGRGHLGYAAADGLRPFGPDVYNNVGGQAFLPSTSGSSVYSATASVTEPAAVTVNRLSVPVGKR